ncbi:hypothetical protein ACFL5Y_03210 [Candidatus Omnitrophota bacterium]
MCTNYLRRYRKSISFLSTITLTIIALLVVYRLNVPSYIGIAFANLDAFQEKAVEVYSQAINLLITLSTLLLGAIWVIFAIEKKKEPHIQKGTFLISAIFLFASILAGLYSHLSLFNQLLEKSLIFDPKSQTIFNLTFQFVTFLIGVAVFSFNLIIYFVKELNKDDL